MNNLNASRFGVFRNWMVKWCWSRYWQIRLLLVVMMIAFISLELKHKAVQFPSFCFGSIHGQVVSPCQWMAIIQLNGWVTATQQFSNFEQPTVPCCPIRRLIGLKGMVFFSFLNGRKTGLSRANISPNRLLVEAAKANSYLYANVYTRVYPFSSRARVCDGVPDFHSHIEAKWYFPELSVHS